MNNNEWAYLFNTSQPDIFMMVGILALGIACFGWYMAFKVRRPMIFRVKLAVVFLIPFMLSGTYLCPFLHFSHVYRMLLIYTFIVMLNILYWRELRKMSTSIGYHKHVLVNFLDMVPDMVWMKDVDNRFTYTNRSICSELLKCSPEEAFGKTGTEIAKMQIEKGFDYTFGEVCCNSDEETLLKDCACRFIEFGEVNGKFIALQVFKAPLWTRLPDGSKRVVGTIGMGRDLTEEYQDHQLMSKLCKEGNIEEAMRVFNVHINRYEATGSCCSASVLNGREK